MAPDWLPLPGDWSYPRLLLGALVLTVVLTGLVAASTSSTSFGAYNPAWDGAASLGDEADAVDSEVVRALNTTAYLSTPAEGTVAVVLAPDRSYDDQDIARVRSFLQRGGTLVVAEDYGRPGNRLLADVGARSRVDGTPLRDEREYYRAPSLPVATNVTASNATEGVDQLTLNHGSVVTDVPADANASRSNATVLVRSSEFAYLDANGNEELDDAETMASRPVVVSERVGNGTVYVVSDPSLFINAMLERPGNRRFVRNLFGAHDRVLLDLSHQSNQPPLAVGVLVLQETPLYQSLLGLVGMVAVLGAPTARRRVSRWRDRRRRGVGGERTPVDRETGRVDREVLVRHLERTHPDWDERRVRRVMTGVLDRPHEGRDDD